MKSFSEMQELICQINTKNNFTKPNFITNLEKQNYHPI